jgi:predicted dehydrogenase
MIHPSSLSLHPSKANLSRRGFLRRSLAALAAAGLPAWYGREVLAAREDQVAAAGHAVAANDKLTMGIVGVGSPASRSLQIYHQVKGSKQIQFTSVCDVDARHLKRAATILKEDGYEVSMHGDFRRMLEDKGIDTVLIGTPDHWHALIAIEAMRKGKDVYCEKPLTLTVEEALALVKVARQTGRVFQTGSQQRTEFGGKFRLVSELVRAGRLGKVSRVEVHSGGNRTSGPLPKAPVPEGLDWDFWLGPTPKVPYLYKQDGQRILILTNCHYEFRWWYQFSGGRLTDWGAHMIDIAQWALGRDGSGPVAVHATGTPPAKEPNAYSCHPDYEVTYTYDDGVKLIAHGNGDDRRDRNIKFVGANGQWIFVDRNHIEASDPKLVEEPLPAAAAPLYRSRPTDQMNDFLECVKSRQKPICDVAVGASSATVCHIGVIALRTGKRLKWDPLEHRFDDAEANTMLSRPMRAPWKLDT